MLQSFLLVKHIKKYCFTLIDTFQNFEAAIFALLHCVTKFQVSKTDKIMLQYIDIFQIDVFRQNNTGMF